MDGGGKNIWVIANWKSNKTISEALDWVSLVGPQIPPAENLKVVVCPVFCCLSEIKKIIKINNFPLMVGSQDLSSFGVGAFTGEEPAQVIKDFVELSIIGHSERRKNFGEDDNMISEKTKQALGSNILPLVCVQGADTPIPEGCKLAAYEPIFAIGTNNPDTPENASIVAASLKAKYGVDLQVLYGGSVDSKNIKSFLNQENINGVLVGNASLNAEEFIKIIGECIGN